MKPTAPVVLLTRHAFRTAPGSTTGLALLVLLASALPAGLAIASGALVATGTTLPDASGPLLGTAFALGILFVLQQVLLPVAQVFAESVGRRLDREVAQRVLAALDRPRELAALTHSRTTELVSAINDGLAGATARDALVGVVNMAVARLGSAAGGVVLCAYQWWLGVPVLLVHAYVMVLVSRCYQRALASAEGAPARFRRARYLRDLLCTAPAAKEIRVFGLAAWILDRYAEESSRALEQVRSTRIGAGRVGVQSALLLLAVHTATFVMLALDVRDGGLSVPMFTTFAVAATGLLGITTVWPDLLNIAVGGGTLLLVDQLEDRLAHEDALGSPAPPRPLGTIVFEGVGFRYPGSSTWVVRGLDLTFRPGRTTAIVGVNGAGKTTVAKLLCGLYRPTEGRITVDGVDIRTLDTAQWQRRFAGLFQDWVRWSLSLRDNVAFRAPAGPATDAELTALARWCGLAEVVDRLPAGWSTPLSRAFGGVDLSGGEWQRVGLARALWELRAGAEVLLLDEPTSAQDVRSETGFYELLRSATSDRSVVLISHRFSIVRQADHIVVLAGGAVVEQGDHISLMSANGTYAHMFTLQSAPFSEGVRS
ncbi:ABC transporter ATP-binding protein [Actinophytocola xanthii]|uniref:ABC transporter ATP-binding protein n=1 Tax=Actinophytocola xanthii TaxID=1912961 RepID=A0A1Q8CK20_9PSEU|nr:ABC transporter ATP-binding protein [Actinophytocola xanthii]OLF14701.1 hypothetical protein BU204_25770 [Actinophytocola xanthii]